MNTKHSYQINPDPFKKKDVDSNAKSKEILVNRPGGGRGGGSGGRNKPAANSDLEPLGEEQTPLCVIRLKVTEESS
jgi:hypothetical protein